ncbi:hypothetical protein PYW08_011911 [Mythimna loreyi]|uniref:Uncharacterized protein n=1 Tax=Mythimna loreyi TaxID=667449 RepID=A0ACC2QPS8_9NEOP|nr:hypothetical protein PYW08_011911 [Mythimna loreyi]
MRAFVLFSLTLVVSVSSLVEVHTNYHDNIGIPEAERIRVLEEEIFAKNDFVLNDPSENRIVGGVLAPANAHPYFGGLLVDLIGGGRGVCGSSLLSPNRLVTAAHCWFDGVRQGWQVLVILGSNFLYSGGERITTSHVIMHPQYFPQLLTNDVAMIYLPRNANVNNFSVKSIRLPNGSELWNQFVGHSAVAAGFGKTSDQQQAASTVVSHVNLNVISHAQCNVFTPGFVTFSTICTSGFGGVGICGGDSGGPLVTYDNNGEPFLIGVSSFAAYNACQRGHPSAYARVTSFHDFITQHL